MSENIQKWMGEGEKCDKHRSTEQKLYWRIVHERENRRKNRKNILITRRIQLLFGCRTNTGREFFVRVNIKSYPNIIISSCLWALTMNSTKTRPLENWCHENVCEAKKQKEKSTRDENGRQGPGSQSSGSEEKIHRKI